jgi:hypothetical protein
MYTVCIFGSSKNFFTNAMYNVHCRNCVAGRGWGEGVLSCVGDHIQREFNTLFLTRFRAYKIARPPQIKGGEGASDR